MPGRLFEDVVEQLYRDDRFGVGTLEVSEGRVTGADRLRGSVLAVVSSSGQVVPFASVLAALANVSGLRLRVLRHDDGHGAALEHVGPLVTQAAHETLWPQIVDWLYTADPGPWRGG